MAGSREEALLQNILGEEAEIEAAKSRIEKIWQYALGIDGVELEPAKSRIETLAIQVAELVRNGGGGYTEEQVQEMIAAAILEYQTDVEPGHIATAEAAAVATYEGTIENGTY